MRTLGVVAVVAVISAGEAGAEPVWWSAEAIVHWSPDRPGDRPGGDPSAGEGDHVTAGVRARYLHTRGPLVGGLEIIVAHGFPIADEAPYTFVEAEPRIGLRRVRARTTERVIERPGGTWVVCTKYVTGGVVCPGAPRHKVRLERTHDLFASLRSRPLDGRLAATLGWRVQRSSAVVERIDSLSREPLPDPVAIVFEANASLNLTEPDGFEKLGGAGIGGAIDAGIAWGGSFGWSTGVRLGLTGLRFVESQRGEFIVLYYLGRGGFDGTQNWK